MSGTILGSEIISKARRILQDTTTGGTRWLDDELLGWINDAQREIVLIKPNSNSLVADAETVQGSKQTLPSGGLTLLAVIRNTAGPAIRRIDRNIMDSENPNWYEDTESDTTIHYIFDEDNPDTYYVYPPKPATPSTIELSYSGAPQDLVNTSASIALNDIYANVILDYVLYRAYSKDSDYAGNAQRATNHYTAFNNSLGNRVQVEQIATPNVDQSGRWDTTRAMR